MHDTVRCRVPFSTLPRHPGPLLARVRLNTPYRQVCRPYGHAVSVTSETGDFGDFGDRVWTPRYRKR